MSPTDWIAILAVVATVVTAALGWWFTYSTQQRQQKREDAERVRLQKREDEQRDLQQKREDAERVRLQKREDEQREKQQRREDEQREKRREDAPHIELAVNCQVMGEEDREYLVEFILVVHNRGLVRWKFRSILLRVRGIERDQPLTYWPTREPRVEFPVKIVDMAKVIPKSVNYLFVEPGVQQSITYVTKIPAQIRYISVYVEFWYDTRTPHTSERVFRLDS